MSYESLRYCQHLELPEVSVKGQKKICNASVLIIGAGGLGCPVATYLVASGIGRIGLVDGDVIEASNLHRQVLYTRNDIGTLKVEKAKERLDEIASGQTIDIYPYFLSEENAADLISQYDYIIDATDNHNARLLINDMCLKYKKTWIYGALYRFEGQVATFHADGPCFSCLFPNITKDSRLENCKEAGILSPVPGIVGSIQALEVLKVILDITDKTQTSLQMIDLKGYDLRSINVKRNDACKACGTTNSANQKVEAA